jgi:hypothetical protein
MVEVLRAEEIHYILAERFVHSAEVVIVYASPSLPESRRFPQLLVTHYAGRAKLGMLKLRDADSLWGGWIGNWRDALGWPAGRALPGGYYLFLRGKACAYHPVLAAEESAGAEDPARAMIEAFDPLISAVPAYERGLRLGRRDRI